MKRHTMMMTMMAMMTMMTMMTMMCPTYALTQDNAHTHCSEVGKKKVRLLFLLLSLSLFLSFSAHPLPRCCSLRWMVRKVLFSIQCPPTSRCVRIYMPFAKGSLLAHLLTHSFNSFTHSFTQRPSRLLLLRDGLHVRYCPLW